MLGQHDNYGVFVYNSSGTLQTTSGNITINGVGGTGTNDNIGDVFDGGSLISTSSGAITIVGNGANGSTTENAGVLVARASTA